MRLDLLIPGLSAKTDQFLFGICTLVLLRDGKHTILFDAGAYRVRGALIAALQSHGLAPADIDVVFADAAAVPELDRAEAAAISGLFGPHGVAVTGPKALTGRLYSGGGPVDLAAAALSIRDGMIPPTAGTVEVPADYQIDLVRKRPRAARVSAALVLARGRWGFNSAVIIREVPVISRSGK